MKTIYLSLATIVGASLNALSQPVGANVLTFDLAHTIAVEALAKCRADGYRVTVLVVDGLNYPKVMMRADGAPASTTEAARMKATTVMLYNRASGPPPSIPPGVPVPPSNNPIPGTSTGRGGVPIKFGEYTIGALSVAGAPDGDKDAACAIAAMSTVASKLK